MPDFVRSSVREVATRITDRSSIKAVSFSSARTTKRFPSSPCASAIQIVRPKQSVAETQPKLQPAALSLSAMISQDFILHAYAQSYDDSHPRRESHVFG